MKKSVVLLLIFAGFFSFDLVAQQEVISVSQDEEKEIIEVYYFHYTRRCATCQAVEDESEAALGKLYPEEVDSGKITFTSVNLEEESNETLAEKLQVAGQSLLVVRGDKQFNLTNDAFKYARSNPEKLQSSIKEVIDPIL